MGCLEIIHMVSKLDLNLFDDASSRIKKFNLSLIGPLQIIFLMLILIGHRMPSIPNLKFLRKLLMV